VVRDDVPMMLRPAQEIDLPVLREVERAAGRCFRDVGMPEIADDEPPPLEVLAGFVAAGTAWVATDGDRPVAYLIAVPVDGDLHIEQVSVHPDVAGRGIGRSLIEHVAGYAAQRRFSALTLTTFADVVWNAPYYERCGFRRLADTALSPGLAAIRRREAEHGLDRWPRVCMRRDLPGPA
jgi:GNAT superfamily N-acetyltransferase